MLFYYLFALSYVHSMNVKTIEYSILIENSVFKAFQFFFWLFVLDWNLYFSVKFLYMTMISGAFSLCLHKKWKFLLIFRSLWKILFIILSLILDIPQGFHNFKLIPNTVLTCRNETSEDEYCLEYAIAIKVKCLFIDVWI